MTMKLACFQAAKANRSFRAYALDVRKKGIEAQAGFSVKVSCDFKTITGLELLHSKKAVCKLSGTNLDNFFKFFNDSGQFGPGNYTRVKNFAFWKSAYDVKPLQYKKLDKTHKKYIPASMEAAPCRRCGLVLPLSVLTIDHQSPQKDGTVDATLRVFRGLGLTKGMPTGSMGSISVKQISSKISGSGLSSSRARIDKYTMNNSGILYFSLLKEAEQLRNLTERCMHNYLNLRPLCAPCNSSLRNLNLF